MNRLTMMDRGEYLTHHLSLLSTNIQHERQKAGFSQESLSIHAGVSKETITRAESAGMNDMKIGTLLSIGWSLDLQPVQLFGYMSNVPRITSTEYEIVQAIRKVIPKDALL